MVEIKWPVYEANQIAIGNLNSSVAITTLWTNRDAITSQVPSDLYCAVGTLYNRKVGIDPLIRNLLARPQIRCLIICGHDRGRSGEALISFFTHGFERGTDGNGNPKWMIRLSDGEYGLIDIEVSEEALIRLKNNVTLIDLRGAEKENLILVLKKWEGCENLPYSLPIIFPKIVPSASMLPSPDTARIFRSPTVVGAWLQAIKEIRRFGTVSKTHYNPAQEIINITTVITEEDPEKFFVPDWLPIGIKEIEAYCEQVLTPILSPGVRYGYGNRIFAYFGYDQLETSIRKLAEDLDTKSAVISIWDPQKDIGDLVTPKSPCVNGIWARLRDGKLYFVVHIRSNDIGEAYLGNGFALRRLQAHALQLLSNFTGDAGLKLGDLTINSYSAHLYESSWMSVDETVTGHFKEVMRGASIRKDPYGSFRITVDKSEIVVTQLSTNEEPLSDSYRGKTALQLATKIADEGIISEPYHAIYLGRELEKAEMAIRFGIDYVQDSPLFSVHGPKPRIMFDK